MNNIPCYFFVVSISCPVVQRMHAYRIFSCLRTATEEVTSTLGPWIDCTDLSSLDTINPCVVNGARSPQEMHIDGRDNRRYQLMR